jgi:aryl carrier-like protein
MFEVTGGGRARTFEDVRDHAIFKVFPEGARRTEVAQMEVDDLSADLIARPFDLIRLMGWTETLPAPGSQPRRHKQLTLGYQSTTLPFGITDSFK